MTAIFNRDVLMAAHATAINGAFIDSTVIKMFKGELTREMLDQSYVELADYVEKIQEAIGMLAPILPIKQPTEVAADISEATVEVTANASQ